ncbi:MAG: hypothetical protein ACMXX9_00780 [Candidatus Woesearchaeota archaeon]
MEQDLQTKLEILEAQNKQLIQNHKINNVAFSIVLGGAIILSGLAGYKLKSVEQNYSLYRCQEQVRHLQMNTHRATLNYSYDDSTRYELLNLK